MAERGGYIKLFRNTLSDPLINKDSDYLALWVHLLCSAAYEPTPALFGGKRIVLQPGQLTTGRRRLAVNSRIEESKVQRILKAFENAQLIEQQSTNKNRLISILSWSEQKDCEQQIERPVNNERTTSEQQANTLEEIKNIRNEEIRNIGADKPPRVRFVVPSVVEVEAYCRERGNNVDPVAFCDFYTSNGWAVGRNKMRDWKAAVRTWERREKKEPEVNRFAGIV